MRQHARIPGFRSQRQARRHVLREHRHDRIHSSIVEIKRALTASALQQPFPAGTKGFRIRCGLGAAPFANLAPVSCAPVVDLAATADRSQWHQTMPGHVEPVTELPQNGLQQRDDKDDNA